MEIKAKQHVVQGSIDEAKIGKQYHQQIIIHLKEFTTPVKHTPVYNHSWNILPFTNKFLKSRIQNKVAGFFNFVAK